MARRKGRLASALLRLGAAAGLLASVAACPSTERCDAWTAPVAFTASGDCGPGGTIVVKANEWNDGQIRVYNLAALGLPEAVVCTGYSRCGYYEDNKCPYQLAQGGWHLYFDYEPCAASGVDGSVGEAAAGGGVDGSLADAAARGDASCRVPRKTCRAGLEADGLWFQCTEPAGAVLCRSHLEPMP